LRVLDAYPWVADRFDAVTEESGGSFANAACPLGPHDSARVRFWVSDGGNKAGVLCLRCWAGCDRLEILRAVGKGYSDCYPDGTDWKVVSQEMVARYPYRDEAGTVLYETVRLEPGRNGRDKDFRQRRKVGSGWEWSLGDVRRVLYRLPELVAADATRTVVVCEGEKDCDSLAALGVLGTTNVCGARSEWLDEYSAALAGRVVVVVEDADGAGQRHANEIVGSLTTYVAGVRRVRLPAKDVTAFLNGQRTKGVTDPGKLRAELWKAFRTAPQWAASLV